jgi:hypothetical protein
MLFNLKNRQVFLAHPVYVFQYNNDDDDDNNNNNN